MKKPQYLRRRLRLLALAPAALFAACTGGFDDINTDPYAASKDDMNNDNYIVSSILTGMQGWVIPLDVNTHQFTDIVLGGALGGYTADSNPGLPTRIAIFNPTNDWTRVMLIRVIPEIYTAYNKLKVNSDDEVALALAEVIRVAAVHRVTDTYGPVPYSQIGADDALTSPYDSQQAVYERLFEELDGALTVLRNHSAETIKAASDKIYAGDLSKWVRFANSLKLRMAMRISYAAPDEAERIVKEALSGENGGVIESNADNAQIPTQNNPFRVVMYDYNGGDSRVSANITSYMNGYKDPRRAKYFTLSTFTGGIRNGYIGLRSGISIPSESLLYSNMAVDYTTPLMWMNAAEVAFLKAEASLRGWYGATGDAERWYEEGVRLSFEQWGLSGDYDAYIADGVSMPESYEDPLGKESNTSEVSTVTVKWDTRGDFETNLEQIITQKWLAIYPEGFEAWCEFRRTGYPRLMPATNNRSGGIIPEGGYANRMPYPAEEYQENNEHINEAVSLLGGPDNMATRLWWDCKEK